MASRKQRKERLRAERIAHEDKMRENERRRRLVQLGSAAAFIAVCLLAVLIVVSQSGGGEGGDTAIEGASAVSSELSGIAQSGTRLGDPDAPVTVTEFGDLQCPVCMQFADQVAPDLISGPVRSGEASYEFRQWAILGPDSVKAAKAALAAGEQDRYWNFIELFYENQGAENSGYVTDEFLTAIAEAAGVPDLEAWDRSRGSDRWDRALQEIDSDAIAQGFTGTPSLLIEGPSGQQALGPATFVQLRAAIDAVR